MPTLRAATIRLAATLPAHSPMRGPLLTVLKEAREEWETVVEGDKIRIRVKDHPDNQLQITELPAKPVKKRLQRRTYDTYFLVQNLHPGGPFLMTNIVARAHLSSGMTFDQACKAMDAALEDAKARVLKNEAYHQYGRTHPGIYPEYTEVTFKEFNFPKSFVSDDDIHFLEVEPADYKPVTFSGKDFSGTSRWGEFTFYADEDEDEYMAQVEGQRAFYTYTASAGARKLFKLLKADPDAVKAMTVQQFTEFLAKSKIGYRHVPTVWR